MDWLDLLLSKGGRRPSEKVTFLLNRKMRKKQTCKKNQEEEHVGRGMKRYSV